MSLRWLALWLAVGALCWVLIIVAALLVVRVAASDPVPWSPPPSAIVSLTAAPGEQQSPGVTTLAGASPASGSAPSAASPGLSRGTGAEADHEAPAVRRPPTRSAAALSFVGVASTYGPGWPASLVALPQGPGWRFRVCGQGGCLVLTSTDKGPDQRLFPDRIVDLDVRSFELVSGQPWSRGLTSVSVTLLGRVP